MNTKTAEFRGFLQTLHAVAVEDGDRNAWTCFHELMNTERTPSRTELRAAATIVRRLFGDANTFTRFASELPHDDSRRALVDEIGTYVYDEILLRTGTRKSESGESWTRFWLYPADGDNAEAWLSALGDGHHYSGAGQSFCRGYDVQVGKYHVLVTQDGGLDV